MDEQPVDSPPIPPVEPSPEIPKAKKFPLKVIALLIIMFLVLGVSSVSILMNKKTTKQQPNPQVLKRQENADKKPLTEQHRQVLMVRIDDADMYDNYIKSTAYLYDPKDSKVSFFNEINEKGEFWLSPTSAYAVISKDYKSLYLLSMDNPSQRTKLYTTESDKEHIEQVVWSKDGSAIVFSTTNEIELYKAYRIKVFKADITDKKAVLVTTLSDKLGIQLREYDPIKREIYLNSLLDPRPAADEKTYRVLSATDGTLLRKVNEGDINLLYGVFAKDFSKNYVTDEKGSLYEYTVNTKQKRLLYTPDNVTIDEIGAPDPYIYGLLLSPDETKLFVSESKRKERIDTDFIIDLPTNHVERIPDIGQLDQVTYSWSPDGNYFCCYVVRQKSGNHRPYFFYDLTRKKLVNIPFDFASLNKTKKEVTINFSWVIH